MFSRKPKKYFIKTYGCQANIADSNKMAGILDFIGFEELSVPKFKTEKEETKYILSHTDVLIINSCSVRQKSDDKIYGLGKPVKETWEEKNKKPFIILAGCLSGSAKSERPRIIFSELKGKTVWVDEYIGPSEIHKLPEILKKTSLKSLIIPHTEGNFAYVNISYGCDNFCTYCVVPYSRGKEISRPEKEILEEIKELVKKGASEVMLCGQNVNSWGLDTEQKFNIRSGSNQKLPFADLLRNVHKIDGLEKISFMSSNPF